MELLFAYILVFVTIFIVPLVVYGLFVKFFGLAEPEKKPRFFLGVIIQKVATAFGFVTLYAVAKGVFDDMWLMYGCIWFVMFALTEIGQIYLSSGSKKEALAGVLSEATYFPLAAFILYSLA